MTFATSARRPQRIDGELVYYRPAPRARLGHAGDARDLIVPPEPRGQPAVLRHVTGTVAGSVSPAWMYGSTGPSPTSGCRGTR
jgi:hypothetical protein